MKPAMSIVVPMFQSERTIAATLASLRGQTLSDIEIVVVDDGSTDLGPDIVKAACVEDPRVQMVRHENRGLAAARNSGIRAARSALIGFCDADDLWAPTKADRHLAYLDGHPLVGLTFSGSVIVDDNLRPTGVEQHPDEGFVRVRELLRANPLGNGSTAVVRRKCLDAAAFKIDGPEGKRTCWFDESFRQSEDIDLWCRIAAAGLWDIRGLSDALTAYRVRGGLSSNADAQVESWKRMLAKLKATDPDDVAQFGSLGEAFQWRWQARKAVFAGDGDVAVGHCLKMVKASPRIFVVEPLKTVETSVCAFGLALFGPFVRPILHWIEAHRRRQADSGNSWIADCGQSFGNSRRRSR